MIVYSADVVCDECKSKLTVTSKVGSPPNIFTVLSDARKEGWHFQYSAGGLAYCPACMEKRRAKK